LTLVESCYIMSVNREISFRKVAGILYEYV